MLAAPDYKAMYLELFRASEQAARLLQEAQARASERKPRWWSVALDVCGLALAASNIAKTERMQKGRHNIG